mmetsp:Transcript_9351/g.20423  ORF Transcript_9351/g.20423 Transcript_9351/m.20423 type:complete len:95 (+) Transcript_9351:2807-3091(+)
MNYCQAQTLVKHGDEVLANTENSDSQAQISDVLSRTGMEDWPTLRSAIAKDKYQVSCQDGDGGLANTAISDSQGQISGILSRRGWRIGQHCDQR